MLLYKQALRRIEMAQEEEKNRKEHWLHEVFYDYLRKIYLTNANKKIAYVWNLN